MVSIFRNSIFGGILCAHIKVIIECLSFRCEQTNNYVRKMILLIMSHYSPCRSYTFFKFKLLSNILPCYRHVVIVVCDLRMQIWPVYFCGVRFLINIMHCLQRNLVLRSFFCYDKSYIFLMIKLNLRKEGLLPTRNPLLEMGLLGVHRILSK